MLTMLGKERRFCDGITRRELLKAGGLGLLGSFFNLPALSSATERSLAQTAHARSVICLFLHGGAATQDMFDLKPDAPENIRGEFRPMATSAPGVSICEHLPRMSRWMHKAALVRSVHHNAGAHNVVPAFTGWTEPVPDQTTPNPNHPPSMGSVCEYLKDPRQNLPAYVCVPNALGWGENQRRPGIYGGFLGGRYDPLCSECEPTYDEDVYIRNRAQPAPLRGRPLVPNGTLVDGVTLDRLDTRRGLLDQLDYETRRLEGQGRLEQFGRLQGRAFDLLTTNQLRSAFDLNREDPRLLDRYGRTLFGSSVLTARKLAEAGVRFVNVFWDNYQPRMNSQDHGWDTHEENFSCLRERYLPWLDQTYSALMEDLDQRGLLEETLVVTLSDFGRTPRINRDAGRDHWSDCYTVMLAGAGIRGGTVYGASDAHAAYVRENPVRPADICATIYHCLGIDPDHLIHDRAGRPVPVAQGGRVIREIVGR